MVLSRSYKLDVKPYPTDLEDVTKILNNLKQKTHGILHRIPPNA